MQKCKIQIFKQNYGSDVTTRFEGRLDCEGWEEIYQLGVMTLYAVCSVCSCHPQFPYVMRLALLLTKDNSVVLACKGRVGGLLQGG